jgi:hypothetical protein
MVSFLASKLSIKHSQEKGNQNHSPPFQASSYTGLNTTTEAPPAETDHQSTTMANAVAATTYHAQHPRRLVNQSQQTSIQLECNCTQYPAAGRTKQPPQHDYGSMGETAMQQTPSTNRHLYQGETFVINEKSYFI